MSYAIPQKNHSHQLHPLDRLDPAELDNATTLPDVSTISIGPHIEKDAEGTCMTGDTRDPKTEQSIGTDENERDSNGGDDSESGKENNGTAPVGENSRPSSRQDQKLLAAPPNADQGSYGNNNYNNNNRGNRNNRNGNNTRYQKNPYHNGSYSSNSYQTFQPSYIPQYPRMIPINQYPVNGGMIPQYPASATYAGSYTSSSGSSPPAITPSVSRRQSQAQLESYANYNINYSYNQDATRYSPPPYYMYTPYVPMYQPPYPASASHSPQMISVSPQAQGFQRQQYGSNRVMHPMQMYYQSNSSSGNQFRGGDYDESAIEDEELKEEEESVNAVATTKGGASGAVTMNLLNLPASETTPESISAIVGQILKGETSNDKNSDNNSNDGDGEDDKKEEEKAFALPIDNFKIYKYPDQELCWCSFQLTDEDKLDLLITNLNGHVFHGSILKCFVQPPRSDDADGSKRYTYSSPQYMYPNHPPNMSGYPMNYHHQHQPTLPSIGTPVVPSVAYNGYSPNSMSSASPIVQMGNGYGRYGGSFNYSSNNNSTGNLNGNGGGYTGFRYAYRHNSMNSVNIYGGSGAGAGAGAGAGRKYSFNQRSKPLGNNYNSIVFPDLDEQDSNSSTSHGGNGGGGGGYMESPGYYEEDLIDDNELSTEELKKFNETRHVSPDRLFIGNIPFNSSYHSLWLFLTHGGEQVLLKELQLKTDSNGLSRGFAVGITDGAESSRELIGRFNGREFENRKLIVRFDKHNGLIFKSHMKKKLDNMGLQPGGLRMID